MRDFKSVIQLQIRCAYRSGHCDFVLWSEFKHLERTDKIEHVNGLRTSNYDSPHLCPPIHQSASEARVRFLFIYFVALKSCWKLVLPSSSTHSHERESTISLTFDKSRLVPITGASDAKYIPRDGSKFARRFLLS